MIGSHGGLRQVQLPRPAPAYISTESNGLLATDERYHAIARETASRQLITDLVIPVRDGRAWEVPAGHVCRFSTVGGPQVLDLNIWAKDDAREHFWASRTRQFYGTHLTTGHRLWSSLPFLRPLATIVADTIQYGRDPDGAGCNDLLGTRCDPYVTELLSELSYDYHCHSNLSRAARTFGLSEFDVHDVINLFQVTGLMPDDGRYFMKSSPAQPGDFIELFAETDLIMAASTCPGGDLSVPLWGPDAGAEPNCNPIGVEVFKLPSQLLEGWTAAKPSSRPWVADEDPAAAKSTPHPALTTAQKVHRRSNGDESRE